MKIAMIGLGRMGGNMARRLLRGGHEVIAYNRTYAKTQELAGEGAIAVKNLENISARLNPPRIVWLMLPAGQTVDDHLERLLPRLEPGDIVIEGGNSFWKDDLRRAEQCSTRGVAYIDAGVSGGIWGLRNGYCLMLGGDRKAYDLITPILDTLAQPGGYMYCGPTGAGHFVKMVHNGIEYGMMQAYAEGFEILEASPYSTGLDFAELSRIWNKGSVVRSWLLELLEQVFDSHGRLEKLEPFVQDSGEGRWTVHQAVESGVPAEVITISLMRRFRSRQKDSFADRLLAAMRNAFGGHAVVGRETKQ